MSRTDVPHTAADVANIPGRSRALVVLAAAALGLLFVRAIVARPHADWPNLRTAARAFLRGFGPDGEPGERLYDTLEMQRWRDREGEVPGLGTYVPQPPGALLPYVPFAALPSYPGKILFSAICLALFLHAMGKLARRTGAGHGALLAALWTTGGAVTASLAHGQAMLLVAALLTYALARHRSGGETGPGILTGVALGLKLFGIPWLLLWALRRRLRPILLASSAAVLVTLIPAVALGPAVIEVWVRDILPASLSGDFHNLYHPASQSIETMLRRALLPHPDWNPSPPWPHPGIYGAASRAVPILLVALGLGAGFRMFPTDPSLALAAQIPFLLLAAPTVTRYHLAALSPLILLLVARAPRAPATWVALGGALLASWAPTGAHVLLQEPRVVGLAAVTLATLAVVRPRRAAVLLAAGLAAASAIAVPVNRPEPPSGWMRITRVPFEPIVARSPARDGSALEVSYHPHPDGTMFSWPGYARDRTLDGGTLLERLTEDGRSGILHQDASGQVGWLLRLPDRDVRQPRVVAGGIQVVIESGRHRERWLLDPERGTAARTLEDEEDPLPQGVVSDPDVSPDRRFLAYAVARGRSTEIRERDRRTGAERVLVAAVARSLYPRYSWDGHSLFFASDAGRCVGCPVIYRISR